MQSSKNELCTRKRSFACYQEPIFGKLFKVGQKLFKIGQSFLIKYLNIHRGVPQNLRSKKKNLEYTFVFT